MSRRRILGFTLIELLITIAVATILISIALPSYQSSVRKGRRSDAYAALAAVQQAQERLRSNEAAYADALGDLNIAAVSPSGYYDLSIGAVSAEVPLSDGYVATAVGKAGTTQADDAQCRKLSVKLQGGNLQYAGCGNCASFTYQNTDPCWPH